jgi:DNA-binding transcriptional LysR family regulator
MDTHGDPLSGRELAAFVAAAEAGSIHGGAEALHLTQSAVTKRLAALERRVGARLLDRGRFGVRLSPPGRALLPYAQQALEALMAAEAALAEPAAGRDALRLAASHTIGEFLLPGWLALFRLTESDAAVTVDVLNSEGVLTQVREGAADIGFIESPADLHGLDSMVLARDEIVVVVAADHRWARRHSLHPAELVEDSFVSREEGSGTRQVATDALRSAGIELHPALQAASSQSLKRMVAAGGFTLLSRRTIEAEENAGTLHAVPVEGVDLDRNLRAVQRRRPAVSAQVRRLWGWLERLAAGDGIGRPLPPARQGGDAPAH